MLTLSPRSLALPTPEIPASPVPLPRVSRWAARTSVAHVEAVAAAVAALAVGMLLGTMAERFLPASMRELGIPLAALLPVLLVALAEWFLLPARLERSVRVTDGYLVLEEGPRAFVALWGAVDMGPMRRTWGRRWFEVHAGSHVHVVDSSEYRDIDAIRTAISKRLGDYRRRLLAGPFEQPHGDAEVDAA